MRNESSELKVITEVKKLTAYVITITEKSPKKFRAVFVMRMQNYCVNTLEKLIRANSVRADSLEGKARRSALQHDAYTELKTLEYISFIALECKCILPNQYQQICRQLDSCISLLVAWRKSDERR
ncbi:MAG: four helix bundle protein [Firmicutes bacterium]|nr:four helix bundle protein [Bacillota bacterium]